MNSKKRKKSKKKPASQHSKKAPVPQYYWDHVFTVDNIIDYGKAAKELASYLRVLFSDGYDSIVIPSRGAIPIFRAAENACIMEGRSRATAAERLDSKIEMLGSGFHSVTTLPFSADPTETTQTSKGIRTFWVKVLAALVRRNGNDPHLVFYQKIIEHLQLRKLTAVLPRDLPTSKFIFIDTVVSGRAICEIIEAFEAEGLNECHLILLVDNNGEGIEDKYKKIILNLEAQGRCTQIHLKNLWTEDRGPTVSGVWSTVYPQVLSRLHGRYEWSKDVYGAGSFYYKVSNSSTATDESTGDPEYNKPVTLVKSSVSIMISSVITTLQTIDDLNEFAKGITLVGKIDKNGVPVAEPKMNDYTSRSCAKLNNSLEYQLYNLKKALSVEFNGSPLEKDTTVNLAHPRIAIQFEETKVSASSSHLVRVEFQDKVVNDLFDDFDKAMLTPGYDALEDDWFRPVNLWGPETRALLAQRDKDRAGK